MKSLPRSQFDIFLSLIVTVLIVLVDRITKNFFLDLLSYGESIPIIKNIFHFTLVYNTGIAFGLFRDMGMEFFIIVTMLLILLIFNILYYKQNDEALSHGYIVGFSLILGGAIGNLIDRIAYGYVIDFFDFRVWPVFNVADSAITIGGLIIAWKCFRLSTK